MAGLIIVGAGGHGKVVADTAYEMGAWEKIAFIDDRYPEVSSILSWTIIGRANQAVDFIDEYTDVVVAIGNNTLRLELLEHFEKLGFSIPSIIHPTAFVSKNAILGSGNVIFAQAVVNAGVKIGSGCIINTGATVDHDCNLDNGVHISPGAHLAGTVKIGETSWIGIGSSVIQNVNIGSKVIVGAGAVITKDIPSNVTVVGVPGRIIKANEVKRRNEEWI